MKSEYEVPSFKSWAVVCLLFSLFLVTLLAPLLLQIVEPRWDARDLCFPSFTYIADSIREGRFPLWDPYTNCGYPFHADPTNPTLNPLALLLGLIFSKTSLGFIAFWALHWWLSGIGMIWLARHFGANPSGALLSALAYSFSGFFVGHAQHTTFIIIAAWLPWIFGLADKAVKDSNPALALLAGASMGLASLGGYPILNLFTGIALALWLFLRFLTNQNPPGTDTRSFTKLAVWTFGTLCVIALVMLAVWSPNMHAFFTEGSGYTERAAPLSPEEALGHPFPFIATVSLFFPFATIIGSKWIHADNSMTNAYMGMLVIPLACLWWFKGNSNRRPWWLLIFAGFMYFASLGGQTGVSTLLYYLLLPLRYMRFSAPFRLYWIFPLCLAAGLGLSHLMRHAEDRKYFLRIFLVWTLIALIIAIYLGGYVFSDKIYLPDGISPGMIFPRLFLPGTVLLSVCGLLFWYWAKSRQGRFYQMVPALIVVIVLADMAAHLYNNSERVWIKSDSIKTIEMDHERKTFMAGEPEPRLSEIKQWPNNDQQITKIPVVEGYLTMKSEGFNEILCKSRFAEVMSSPHRFWISPGIEKLQSKEEGLETLSKTGITDPLPVFLENPPNSLPVTKSVSGSYGHINILSYAPEKIVMTVNVPGETGAFLASTERYAAGWKAYIDGVPQKVWKTNLYFRGIFLPVGNHTIVWRYDPNLWKPLVMISFTTLLISIGAAIFMLIKQKFRFRKN